MIRASLPIILRLLGMLCAALLAGVAAQAQDINIAAHLQVEGPVAPGGETRIAIRFTPRSNEWHGYWSNPGDAGLGMQVEWQLPEGVSVGGLDTQ